MNAITVGQSVSTTVAANLGTTPFTWSVSSGTVPAGLTLHPSTGAITGTPTTAGTANFAVKVTDAHSLEDTQALTWTVNASPSIDTTTLPETTVSAVYSQTLSSSGGTGALTWSVSAGSLPTGLSLNPSTGAITGTTTTAGTANFTVKATDTNSVEAAQALDIVVNAALSVTTTTLPFGVTTLAYSQTLASTDGTGAHTWAISAGALPAGLTLNPSTGAITGTPTATGTANFTAEVTDSLGITGSRALSIEVVDHPDITTTSLTAITVGQNVSTAVAATAGTEPYTWAVSAGALPAGLTLNPSTGAITGTPSTAGTASFTASVTDDHSLEDSQALSWTVNEAPAITTASLPETTIGRPLPSTTMAATGGMAPLTWSATGLPAGVTLTEAGVLSGTPTVSGAFSATVTLTDTNSVTDDKQFTLTINQAPAITTTTLPRGTVGTVYSHTLTSTGGTGTHAWTISAGQPPATFTLSNEGVFTGTPAATSTASFTVEITDDAGATAAAPFTLEVVDPVEITTTALDAITVGQDVSVTIATSGGNAPFTWSVTAGALPAGVTASASTGILAGKPSAAGTASFTLEVTDVDGRTAAKTLTWPVNPAPQVITASLPTATVNGPYSYRLAATGGTDSLAWGADGLPAGMTIDADSGLVSGVIPVTVAPPSIELTFTVTDDNGVVAERSLTLPVAARLKVTTATLPPFTEGEYGSASLEATGGVAPLTWSGTAPSGLQVEPSGTLAGIPAQQGTYYANVRVSDRNGAVGEGILEVRVGDPTGFRMTPQSLSFTGVQGGEPTSPQQVAISSTPTNQSFQIAVSDPWLQVSFDHSVTPAVLNVTALPESLDPGVYRATISLLFAESSVAVEFTVAAAEEPDLTFDPGELTIKIRHGADVVRRLLMAKTTGNPGPVSATVDEGSPWLSVTARPLAAGEAGEAMLIVRIDPSSLAGGTHEASIQVSAGALTRSLPVQVEVSTVEYELSHTGLTFDGIANAGTPPSQELRILNRSPQALAWSATAEASWIRLDQAAGTAHPLSLLAVGVDPAGLEPGVYASTLRVAPLGGGVERVAEIRLNLDASHVPPQASPGGLLFRSEAGAAPPDQEIVLSNTANSVTTYALAVTPEESASWLTVTPTSGWVATGASTTLAVHVQPEGLAVGAHQAGVTVEFADGSVRVVQVMLVVAPEACSPSSLRSVFTKPGDHFDVRPGWPVAIEVLVTDNCGEPISDGAGLVHFSEPGEAALHLITGPGGLWTATWSPVSAHASITATATIETSDDSLAGTAQTTGTVASDPRAEE